MIKLRKLLSETVWNRNFGEPLPTLEDVMEKHNGCGCDEQESTNETVTEDARDVIQAKKLLQKLGTIEARFRETMYKLDDRLNADIPNQKFSAELRKSYTKNVTKFMRDMVGIVKRMK